METQDALKIANYESYAQEMQEKQEEVHNNEPYEENELSYREYLNKLKERK